MIFESNYSKYSAMKKILTNLTALLILASCSSTKEAQTSSELSKSEKKLVTESIVKKAVESKRYIVRFDRMYFNFGGITELIPRSNYIIIDGSKAIISTAYIGKQYDIRPIVGISMKGESSDYEVTNNIKKGNYEVKMKVINKTNTFDVYLTIDKTGRCDASINNLYTSYIRYRGTIIPIKEREETVPLQDNQVIG
jgi:uncharacterized membrane-anchored protein